MEEGLAVEVTGLTELEGLEGVVPEEPPLKVEPMGPNLMLEKMTLELGALASTSAGTPEVVGHSPR